MSIKEMMERTGWTMRQFSDWFGIPYRTVQNWASGARECPTYVRELMMYKLIAEKIIEESEKV